METTRTVSSVNRSRGAEFGPFSAMYLFCPSGGGATWGAALGRSPELVLGPVKEIRSQCGEGFITGQTKGTKLNRDIQERVEIKGRVPVEGGTLGPVRFLRFLRRHDEDCVLSTVGLIQVDEPHVLRLLHVHLVDTKNTTLTKPVNSFWPSADQPRPQFF